MEKFCVDCGRKVSNNNTTGKCKSCGVKHSWTRPECRKSHEEGSERFLEVYHANPEMREIQSEKCKANWTEENKATASEQAKRRWDNPEYKAKHIKNLNRGIISEEHRASMEEKIWNNPIHKENTAKAFAEVRTDPARRKALVESQSRAAKRRWAEHKGVDNIIRALRENSKNQFNPSGLELKVAKAFDELGVDYIQQFNPKNYNRIYDFLLPDFNLLVEVDGDYWHSSDRAKAVDGEKTNWAYANNYSLVRLKEHDIKEFGALTLVQTELADYIPEAIEL